MSNQKQYEPPEAMVEWVGKNNGSGQRLNYPICRLVCQWIAENPIVPTEKQTTEILNTAYAEVSGSQKQFKWAVREFQRRMFLKREPEVPENIKDLLFDSEAGRDDGSQDRIIEAYRRGLKDGGKGA